MSEDKGLDNEVLLEKVREIEAAKRDDKIIDKENTAYILGEKSGLSAPLTDGEAGKIMSRRSRRSFLIGGAAAVAGYFGYRWLRQPDNFYIFERMFRFNENVSQTFFESSDLAPEFPRELAGARVNGLIGMGEDFSADSWRLQVTGLSNPQQFSLDEIKSLPRTEMTTELKCIEGWSIICNWTGVRFSDFAAQFFPVLRDGGTPNLQRLPENLTQYVSLVTPDQGYYVGWDMQSILHPQTLLAYGMNGEPLKPEHGAPLRLVSATKYGIKQLKRIGSIEFTNVRPADYWAEQGYDWYSGH